MERRLLFTFHTVALCLYLAGVVFYLNSPLRFDETEWPPQARAILQRGVPKILYQEENILRDRPYYGWDAHYGMWHPPAYQYSLALAIKAFGYRTSTFRLAGVVFFVFSLILAMRIFTLLDHDRTKDSMLQFLPVSMCLMSPLLVEGSLYLDIDNTVLTSLILIFIYFFLRFSPKFSFKQLILCGLLFTACLWAKLTSPLLLPVAIVLYLLLNKEGLLKTLKVGFAVGAIGLGVFVLAYLVYCRSLNYPASFMFKTVYAGRIDGLLSLPVHGARETIRSLRYNFIWASPMLSLLFFGTVTARVRNFIAIHKLEPVDFLITFALIGLVLYISCIGTTHGKYTFPLVMVGTIASAHELKKYLPSDEFNKKWLFGIAFLALVFYLLFVPVLQAEPPPAAITPARNLFQAALARRNLSISLSLLPLVAPLGLGLRRRRGGPRGHLLMKSVFCCLMIGNSSNFLKTYLSKHEYSPYHPLNEDGFLKTVEYLNRNAEESDILLSPKDFGFYYKGNYYSVEDVLLWEGGVKAFKEKILRPDINLFVDSVKYPLVRLSESDLEDSGLRLVSRMGDYAVYRKSPLFTNR